jgi:hypothetical protein
LKLTSNKLNDLRNCRIANADDPRSIKITSGNVWFHNFGAGAKGKVSPDGIIDTFGNTWNGGVRTLARIEGNALSGTTESYYCMYSFQMQKR